jgi:hypothetical protein
MSAESQRRKTKTCSTLKTPARRAPIPVPTQLRLWVRAGGRCEFLGCNEYLLRDNLTLSETNCSDIAHIVAAKPGGTRGKDSLPVDERSKIENLMLVCKKHHKLIDDQKYAKKYPRELLMKFKREHENRIHRLTDIKPGNKTTVVRLRSNIASDSVSIPRDQIYDAIYPRYPEDDKGLEIDLTKLPGTDSPSYWKSGAECIRDTIRRFFAPSITQRTPEHISVFALGPIPFLIQVGCSLGSKIPTDVYQKHWDNQSWQWKKRGNLQRYQIVRRKTNRNQCKVALLLSISGSIGETDIPLNVAKDYNLYEITLERNKPHPMCVRTKRDLYEFKITYLELLHEIHKHHSAAKEILLFPAVPVSVAVICGITRLPKVDPSLIVYDFNSAKGKFYRTLKVR